MAPAGLPRRVVSYAQGKLAGIMPTAGARAPATEPLSVME